MRRLVFAALILAINGVTHAQGLGRLSANPYDPLSTSNRYGVYGSPYSPRSVNNPYSVYGSPYSPNSVNNPYAWQTPKLYDQEGNYRGKLSSNPYDADSISNPYGRYGSPFSSESITNPFGAGSPYRVDSPTNPYGTGWTIVEPRSRRTGIRSLPGVPISPSILNFLSAADDDE